MPRAKQTSVTISGLTSTLWHMKIARKFALSLALIAILTQCSGGATNSSSTTSTTQGISRDSANSVIFFGDSVTAGFGFCGNEGGADSSNISCSTNASFANNWVLGNNSLKSCQPVIPSNDRCSNNNFKGSPWDAGPWRDEPGAPKIAFSYQIAKMQDSKSPVSIVNWAMTGSTPAQWDPLTGGVFGPQLQKITNTTAVLTLGANPILSSYLKITGFGVYTIANGVCAETALVKGAAAPLDNSELGILHCANQQWEAIEQSQHLLNIYKTLLQNGNRVLVLGYPQGCPWSFGNWQPIANPIGPASGKPCTSNSAPSSADKTKSISQFDQAVTIGTDTNNRIKQLVSESQQQADQKWFPGKNLSANIHFVLPDQMLFSDHQAWSSDSWFFKNDTWVHPNESGHRQLALTVIKGMCENYKHWCGDKPVW
ncbi:unannotated protein [freshwater metagenome]|uniref:Unannotated protein n=1 Tax=freshwater metagenome TaxID=449393 RepID=A0A6J5ZQ67_9ZZZZ